MGLLTYFLASASSRLATLATAAPHHSPLPTLVSPPNSLQCNSVIAMSHAANRMGAGGLMFEAYSLS